MSAPRSFASGGWVIALAIATVGTVFSLHLWRVLSSRTHAVGDGKNPGSYGFTLAGASVPAAQIVAAGMPKDGLPALLDPVSVAPAQLRAARGGRRGKLLVPSDRVAGVRLGNASRAYPLRFLAWHEVVNDSLGGRPIAVTYNPLCDSVVVVSRRVGGEVVTFGVSGLLYNSNLLMYDRRAASGGESLWSQLLARAVAGPAAARGAVLEVLPVAVTTWRDWTEAHPDTTVLAPDQQMSAQYRRDPYGSYFGSDRLRFPASPLMATDRMPLKTPVVVVLAGSRAVAAPFPVIRAHAGPDGLWDTTFDGMRVRFTVRERPETVGVSFDNGAERGVIYSFAFAWHAMHPVDTLWLE